MLDEKNPKDDCVCSECFTDLTDKDLWVVGSDPPVLICEDCYEIRRIIRETKLESFDKWKSLIH